MPSLRHHSFSSEAAWFCDRHKASQESTPLTATASGWRSAFLAIVQKLAQ
ncbi:MAG: hypothetical protein AAF685_07950 [Cyanobacteria bacterium P01_C01_bin.89]